ncbi:Eco57I restriction-modification methylase domain-containing protein [Leptotrichia wadei]|uniref:Eco57I restriction-modification methylase domain-containing protein n=1 Tax=Leptotrichia wadei TaxID=157687 RepID=UPI0028D3B30F|nr:N-6 DNA methylase [Leptotrichia wadei]
MNNLFNQKILAKKAEEEVDLSKHNFSERRKALNKWINNLENGILDKSKEEEFQGEFLYDIFTTVLRAVNKSDGKNEWNLERETKTKLDGQKADGVLGFFDADGKKDVRAVIELKGAKVSLDVRQKRTGDTRTPVEQAFNYAPKYGKNCQWVIVSNYKEIRLYRSNDMTEYQVFFLEKLKDDLEFKKFIYILSFYALVGTEKKKAKTIELSEEYQKNQAEIEKKFYNEYKAIRLHIFENMRKNNPAVNENTIIEKVQKLLDRFLFICFCEDKGLLPNEIFYKTLEKGKNFGDVFEVFKMLCNWINLGNPRENIAHFNGGLFKNDDVLESLYVDNEVFEEMRKISEYDFDSELNENILGHIFEQSISDIEDLKKELNGEEFDKKKGKRKKDGIFYTPKYITKYIVENSIKNWLDDKRKELGEDKLPELSEADFEIKYSSKKSDERIYSKNYKKHIEFWTKYREAVKNIKIVDPACGSGAFLITAFEYLLNYNNYLNDKIFDLTGTKDLFSDTTRKILQNNIFGVDLNKESVEITKLSLWLKTANKNKTLATLENNIKCGNSLIDDIEIAGELAFNWEKEFPQVFKNGGFDVVIGNPPYVRVQGLKENYLEQTKYYEKNYVSATGSYDIYALFMEKGFKLINKKGLVSFILPHKFLVTDFGSGIRKFFVEKRAVESLLHFGSELVFSEASTYTCIVTLSKKNKEKILFKKVNPNKISEIFKWDKMDYNLLSNKNWDLQSEEIYNLIKKLKKQPYTVEEVFKSIFQGIATSLDDVYVFEGKEEGNIIKGYNKKFDYEFEIEKELVKPILGGKEVSKYCNMKIKNYVLFPYHRINNKMEIVDIKYIENNLPLTKKYLENFEKEIKGREKGKMSNRQDWYAYIYPKNLDKFDSSKIMTREISLGCNMTYDSEGKIYHNTKVYSFVKNKKFNVDDKFYLALLNSKVMWFFIKNTGSEYSGGYYVFKTNYLKPFPLPEIPDNAEMFIEKADKMLFLNKNLQELSQKFQRLLIRKFELEKLSTKLQDWYLLKFSEFVKELKKAKIKLSLKDEMEWEEIFLEKKEEAEKVKNEIEMTDKEIDRMVYELYELSEEEVNIIERN